MQWLNDITTAISNWWAESAGSTVAEGLGKTGLAVLKCVAILIIGFWIAKIASNIISKTFKKAKSDEAMAGFVVSCVKFAIKLIVIIAAIAALGVNITSIITALGAAGITIGLAMQDTLSNFASGILILYNRPFVIGDYVEIDGSSGTVKHVELMTTTLTTADNKEIILPNSRITSNKVINYTHLEARRLDMQFSVAYGTDAAAAKQAILNVCENSDYRIAEAAAPVVGINNFGSSAIVFDMRMWIKASDYWAAYYDTQEKILAEFARCGIVIPFDQLDVHIKNN